VESGLLLGICTRKLDARWRSSTVSRHFDIVTRGVELRSNDTAGDIPIVALFGGEVESSQLVSKDISARLNITGNSRVESTTLVDRSVCGPFAVGIEAAFVDFEEF
jgi:hypothetical protein